MVVVEPMIVKSWLIKSSPEVRSMVPERPGLKTIVSPFSAYSSALRSEPAPLSFRLLTVIVIGCGRLTATRLLALDAG